jgi:hypothetical protein
MADRFTIKIPCKPYTRVFLELNCGDPADLTHLRSLFKEFKSCLSKKSEHREGSILTLYKDEVTIIIPTDMFYRLGWEMNKENLQDFNRAAEQHAKFFMRQFISINNSAGVSVCESIKEFQDKFGFAESIWGYESIKKDYDRNGKMCELKLIRGLRVEINKILLNNLSYLGIISTKLKKEYINS